MEDGRRETANSSKPKKKSFQTRAISVRTVVIKPRTSTCAICSAFVMANMLGSGIEVDNPLSQMVLTLQCAQKTTLISTVSTHELNIRYIEA